MVQEKHIFKLFIAGDDLKGQQAIGNLRRMCDEDLQGEFELQIIDILKDSQAATVHRIVTTPTLIRVAPLPKLTILGDLSNRNEILKALSISPESGAP